MRRWSQRGGGQSDWMWTSEKAVSCQSGAPVASLFQLFVGELLVSSLYSGSAGCDHVVSSVSGGDTFVSCELTRKWVFLLPQTFLSFKKIERPVRLLLLLLLLLLHADSHSKQITPLLRSLRSKLKPACGVVDSKCLKEMSFFKEYLLGWKIFRFFLVKNHDICNQRELLFDSACRTFQILQVSLAQLFRETRPVVAAGQRWRAADKSELMDFNLSVAAVWNKYFSNRTVEFTDLEKLLVRCRKTLLTNYWACAYFISSKSHRHAHYIFLVFK